ncbi:MAG: metallophosphoesterase [Armatimonadota bacterium]|jgi:2',3'-cyclic-nucleotide 2'-phosphodiesterase (5'-nucleotidase family)
MPCRTLTIIHTADFHARLTPEKAERLRRMKAEHADCLLLDAGDAVRAGNVWFTPGPDRTLQLMNEAGYDAMALGNREYFFRKTMMAHKIAPARFPVISSNLVAKSGDIATRRQMVACLPNGLSVGIFALSREMIRPGSFWDRFSDSVFRAADDVTREQTADLRSRADVVVALSHLGRPGDEHIVQSGANIGLLLAGHEHSARAIDSAAQGGPPYVSWPGAYAETAAVIEAEVDGRAIVSARSQIVPI